MTYYHHSISIHSSAFASERGSSNSLSTTSPLSMFLSSLPSNCELS